MNHYTTIGNLTRDPELRELPSGQVVCEIELAVDEMGRARDENGRRRTGFISVQEFGEGGRAAAKYLHRGSQVAVAGRLQHSPWKDAERRRHQSYEVVGHIEFLSTRAGSERNRDRGAEQEQHEDQMAEVDASDPAALTPAPAATQVPETEPFVDSIEL